MLITEGIRLLIPYTVEGGEYRGSFFKKFDSEMGKGKKIIIMQNVFIIPGLVSLPYSPVR
jgi:hypothetical protein